MHTFLRLSVVCLAVLVTASVSGRLGFANEELSDAEQRGQALFEAQCGICHDFRGMYKAPRLGGLFGRAAGSLTWPYSEIFLQAEFVWTEDILDAYLELPREMMPGNNMAFYGIDDAADRRDLIAYIKKTSAAE